VREFTVPAAASVPENANLTDPVWDNAAGHPSVTLFARRDSDGWTEVSAVEFRDQVTAVAKGLVAEGVQPGDRVGLMSKTRYEWTLCDYAIWAAGAVTVPIYETSSAEQTAWILSDSGITVCVVESSDHEALVESVRPDLPGLRHVLQIDAGGVESLIAAGAVIGDSEIEDRRAALQASDLATIIYTSGTTGRPKGCELTHGALLFDVLNAMPGLNGLFRQGGSTLLFLPLAHVFARLIQCGTVATRTKLGHTADVKNLLADLATFRPTFVLSVPRVFEKVYNGAKQKANAAGKGAIFDRAEQVAVEYSEALDSGGPSFGLKLRHALFDRLVYGKLRAALGGRCTAAFSGGAPLGSRLGHFFRGIGLTIYEGYGLTETCAASTANLQSAVKIGTVGRPIPGVELRISDEGEVLIRGGHLFRGYWKNPAATAEALDAEGWFHSGDLGELDTDGFLRITGRKKELIVTAHGKNVAPAVLEDRLRAHLLISQCMVVGDQQPFIGCLITLDPEAIEIWKKQAAKPPELTMTELIEDPGLLAVIQEAVDQANQAVSKAEAIRKFRILTVDFTEQGGELTPSLKLKRHVVAKQYAEDIKALYE
jgi:long-chain acyl-CoA synthetase